MFAIPTVVILFILGPLVLMGFVATLVLPIVYLALRSKIKDPAAAKRLHRGTDNKVVTFDQGYRLGQHQLCPGILTGLEFFFLQQMDFSHRLRCPGVKADGGAMG